VKRLLLLAACLPVAGLLTAVPAAAQAGAVPGVVSGVVTAEATGEPVGGACVTLFDLALSEVASGCADADGRYEIADVVAGPYKARATANGFAELWAYNRGSALAADVLNLPHALNFGLRQGSGTLRGRITDLGAPAAGASVTLTDVDQRWLSTVTTAEDGTYAFTALKPDAYKLTVTFGDRSQWARQKSDVFSADSFEVLDGQVTVVDEEVAPYATVRVVATDEVTGAPVAGACATLWGSPPPERRACAGADGVALIENVPPFGYFTLSVWAPDGAHWPVNDQSVALSPGHTTQLDVPMRPAAVITTTVRDARTSAPLENICVEPHAMPVVGVIDRDYLNHCSDATGRLVIGPIEPGTYQLLVKPLDERYGMQWVGRRGGTGDLREARQVSAPIGEPVAIPPIAMDLAGSITGVVTDRATGAPVTGVCVFPYAVDPRIGFDFDVHCSRNGGVYTVSGLGPYAWPLQFVDAQARYAAQWSGGAADRFGALPVRVQPNATVTADAALVPGGSVNGRTLDEQGNPSTVFAYVYNARTGDILDWATSNWTSEYTIKGLATQRIKIQYYMDANCWYRDAADFTSATRISVTAGQTTGGIDLRPCTP
jgi:hypothetical protein